MNIIPIAKASSSLLFDADTENEYISFRAHTVHSLLNCDSVRFAI